MVEKIRILQLCNKFIYPPKDGGAIGIFNYTKAFSRLGHEVTVLAMNTSKHPFDLLQLPEDVKSLAQWISVDIDNSLKITAALYNLIQGRSYHISRFISAAFNDKLIELLHQKEFDIIQIEGLYLSPYVETIRAFSLAKIVMRSHNIEHEIWQRIANNEKSIFKKSYLKILASQLKTYEVKRLNKYDMVTAVTDRDALILKNLGCELPIHVCPAPYDEMALASNKKQIEWPSVFFVGALDWLPNQEGLNWFILKVWPLVLTKCPDLKLYIAGRNASHEHLPQVNNCILVGEVENAYDFMNSKGIMIVPLLSGSGIRVKIIEGMALGKTIVTTSIGAEGIPCKDGQNILIADSIELFAEKIIQCVNERIFFTVIGDNAQYFAKQRFSSKEIAIQLLNFFKQNF